MKIVEYDEVNPQKAMLLTRLAFDLALTPENAMRMRRTDPRLFPCLAIYAEEDDAVLGQAGILRLPMISTEGREDVGGLWAVSTHPGHTGRGVASILIEEAHTRMRRAGLRFSFADTDRFCLAHKLLGRHGYVETNVWATALARWETAHQPTRLRAQPAGPDGYDCVERLFTDIARDHLGFAWRHTPFMRLRTVKLSDLWILRENQAEVGYALAHADQNLLTVTNFVVRQGIDAAEAVAALAAEMRSAYVQVKASRPVEMTSFKRAGYQVAHPTWNGLMVKALAPEITAKDAWQLFGIGTDRFLVSWMDVGG